MYLRFLCLLEYFSLFSDEVFLFHDGELLAEHLFHDRKSYENLSGEKV